MATPTIDRRCHWLRRNAKSKRPEALLFVDTEANETPQPDNTTLQTFKLGWACLANYVPYNGLEVQGWYKIEDLADFWNVVSQVAVQHKCTYVVSHNIDYDARVLRAFTILPRIGFPPAYAILGESCRFFTFKADKNTIALLDNLNYWRLPLSEIGAELGIEKLAIDFKTATLSELSTYCKRDVEILVKLWDYWLRFLDEHQLGNFAITVAGQAMNSYRHRFMRHEIGIHNRQDAIALERASYKGGRCEVFRAGHFTEGPYYKLDVNGLYAYVMRTFPTPRKLVKVLVNVSPQYLSKLLERYQVIGEVLLDTDEPYYAIHSKGYNVFPTGQFKATLTTPEIEHALEKGHIRGIGQVAIYEGDILFAAFIDHFTPLRQKYKANNDTARSMICKLLRNSLYGKFGQHGYSQEIIGDAPIDEVKITRWQDLESGLECFDLTFGGVRIRQERKGESQDSFPGIASHIAAYARVVLWEYALLAGLENCYYADTDSLIVDQVGYDNLVNYIDPLKLGYLKVEGTSEDLEVLAKKSYVFNCKRTMKGIRENATRLENGAWEQVHFTSLKWAFGAGALDDVLVYEVEKHQQNTLTHGTIRSDGTVRPPQFSATLEDVAELIAPVDAYAWDWWIDVPWFQSLFPRLPRDFLREQPWFALRLSEEEPPAF